MSSTLSSRPITTTELYALPDDGIDREIFRGELREYPMTRRNQAHSRVVMAVGYLLALWMLKSGNRGGEVTGAEVGVRLSQSPETTVGIDVAYFSPEAMARSSQDTAWLEGPPTLAVEVLSPSDKHEDVVEKVELYLENSVPVVWIIDPDFEQISIHRAGIPVVTLNITQTLEGHPELPEFSVPVKKLFSLWN
jgi:Uma2 family endonuclease